MWLSVPSIYQEVFDLGYNKNQEKEIVWSHLCSNPVHVFQLISISRLIVEEILPNFSEWPPCKYVVNFFQKWIIK